MLIILLSCPYLYHVNVLLYCIVLALMLISSCEPGLRTLISGGGGLCETNDYDSRRVLNWALSAMAAIAISTTIKR